MRNQLQVKGHFLPHFNYPGQAQSHRFILFESLCASLHAKTLNSTCRVIQGSIYSFLPTKSVQLWISHQRYSCCSYSVSTEFFFSSKGTWWLTWRTLTGNKQLSILNIQKTLLNLVTLILSTSPLSLANLITVYLSSCFSCPSTLSSA